ncbi:F-box only protein 40-like [Mastacembelus armatus]|uniref:F-box only protein 40-like n=1 Tax=Mastacembelus armatus TaxID=205130 RepID=A0A3Q3SVB7_9TELE|nr:F-box only protein 40-like [Mastacembelus armatus]XP_026183616.1 F-box only protein 40-like [Mastacembelus armatus]
MSHRSRASRVRQHAHCDSCYSRRCRTRVEVSVCCAVIPCRLNCGALFHLCKEEDHLLLCPNVRVPCFNAEYGCPVHLPRSSRAAHLQVCPASVVCCSMEWNRWPCNDAHSHPNTELHENLLREREHKGCLDLAMALKDQDHLFHSMKIRKLFPELIQNVDEEEIEEERREEERRKEEQKQKKAALEKEEAERAAARAAAVHIWDPFNMFNVQIPDEEEDEDEDEEGDEDEVVSEQGLTQEERVALARATGVNADSLEHYSSWERMFSMEIGGCREAAGTAGAGRGQRLVKKKGKRLGTVLEEDTAESSVGATASNTYNQVAHACNGPSTSSSSCLTGKLKKNYVSGYLEPMKIITVRTFKVPTSFSAKQSRIRNPGFYKRESQAVDTSDLGVAPEEMPVWEEVQASLLCSLEKEQRGHLIAESICSDGLLQDEGAQTYNFLSAPFRRNTSLADLTTAKPLELHLQLQVESVTSRHHKASSAFTFLCGQTFQRREYGKHYKNIHSDIQMGVNGWFEQRCPLAYLGCTYSQRRFQPSTHEATVNYNEHLGCFSLHPTLPVSLCDDSQSSRSSGDSSTSQRKRGGQAGGGEEDWLSSLPYEVLCHMASFLDSLSLSQLALVSRLMRQVCSSLLQERGMVTLRWERKTDSDGGAKWRVKQRVWQFSTFFSPVDSWSFQDRPPISQHLKVCPYYESESRTEKIRLPRFRDEAQTNTSCKGLTLVNLFQQKRIMM